MSITSCMFLVGALRYSPESNNKAFRWTRERPLRALETGRATADNDGIIGDVFGSSLSGHKTVHIGDDPGKGKGQAMEKEEQTPLMSAMLTDTCG